MSSDDDARQTPKDRLYHADLVDAATRSVHIGSTNCHTLDGRGELGELPVKLPPDVSIVVGIEIDAEHPYVDRERRRVNGTFVVFDHAKPGCTARASRTEPE